LRQYFRHLPQYKDGFAAIFSDPLISRFRSDTLDRIRDELVFHFDRDTLAIGLSRFPEGEALIASATEFKLGETYFDVADEALLAYLFGDGPTGREYLDRIAHFLQAVSALFSRFMQAAHSLIPAALLAMGCYVKPMKRPDPISDDEG
jgi:hypothetical protein